MYARSYRTIVHPVLAVDYIADLTVTDEDSTAIAKAFSDALATPKDLAVHIKRHPRFAERVTEWSENASSREMALAAIEILREARTDAEHVEQMHQWLSSERTDRAALAITQLRTADFDRFIGESGPHVARAIARIATARKSFDKYEIQYLYELGDNAEPAVDCLFTTVASQLGRPGHLHATFTLHDKGKSIEFRPMIFALKVLSRFPEKAKPLLPAVRESLRLSNMDKGPNPDPSYSAALTDFLKAVGPPSG